MIEVNTQTTVFLQSLLLGFALGLLYDVFRVLRLAVRHSATAIFAEDISFFAACAVLTFLFSLAAVNGHVRIFLVLGEFLGASVYYVTLGALVMRVSKTIIRFVKAVLRLLYRIFIAPILRLLRWIARLIDKIAQKLGIKAKKFRTNAKYTLKRQSVLVYNLYVKQKNAGTKSKRLEGGAQNAKGRSQRVKNRKSALS